MYAEISTDDRDVVARFISEHINGEYAMIVMKRKESGQYRVSINTEMEPEPEPII